MGGTIRLGMIVAAGAAVMGCSSNSLTQELLVQQNDAARAFCDCFYDLDGYASASECRQESTFPIVSQAVTCGDRALAADGTGEVRASLQCFLDNGAVRNDCYRAAGCDQTAFDACDTDYYLSLVQCPVPSSEAQADYDAALRACILGLGGGGGGPELDVCPEDDLGSATGDSVATGSTVSADNDIQSTCGGYEANDAGFSWVAPTTGTVTIDTFGSNFDTILHVFEGDSCAGTELACDDDGGDFLDSSITMDVTMGDHLVIVVDGWGDESGAFVLNINY